MPKFKLIKPGRFVHVYDQGTHRHCFVVGVNGGDWFTGYLLLGTGGKIIWTFKRGMRNDQAELVEDQAALMNYYSTRMELLRESITIEQMKKHSALQILIDHAVEKAKKDRNVPKRSPKKAKRPKSKSQRSAKKAS